MCMLIIAQSIKSLIQKNIVYADVSILLKRETYIAIKYNVHDIFTMLDDLI